MSGKLLLMALFWSCTFIFGRMLSHDFSSTVISIYRYLIALLILGFIVYWNKTNLRYSIRQHVLFILLGLSGITLYNIFFFTALSLNPAGRNALIVTSNPVFIALFAVLFFGERAGVLKIFGIIFSVVGVCTVILAKGTSDINMVNATRGDSFAFGAMLSWVVYSIFGKVMLKGIEPLPGVFFATLYGFAALLGFGIFQGIWDISAFPDLIQSSMLVYLGLFGTVLPFLWFYEGIKKMGALHTAAFINLVPVFTILLSVIFLNETFSIGQLIGGIFVIAGVSMVNGAAKLCFLWLGSLFSSKPTV